MYSITILGILVSVVGTALVNFGFSEQCANEFVRLAPAIFGAIIAWFGRVRVGDINWLGFRKKPE